MKRTLSVFLLIIMVFSLCIPLQVIAAEENNTYREATEDIIQKYRINKQSTWNTWSEGTTFTEIDGILLQTDQKPYCFRYKAKDAKHNWNDLVYSTDTGKYDYAGWPKYAITSLSIDVYDSSGKINENYIVFYRTKVGGVWLDWVSNGNLAIMETIQKEFGITGTLDDLATESGSTDTTPIEGFEIRMFEKIETPVIPTENAVILDVPYLFHNYDYPNACESLSAVMALLDLGINIDIETFISDYLDLGNKPVVNGIGPDPEEVYCGDPRLRTGWGCHSPVIVNALNKFLDPSEYTIAQSREDSLDELCRKYIDHGIPVLVWGTINMVNSNLPENWAHWTTVDGKEISYNRKFHCLLLIGYDENYFYFNDPMFMHLNGPEYTAFSRSDVETAFALIGNESIAIYPVDTNVKMTPLPSDFTLTPPENLYYDGQTKIFAFSGSGGMGSITYTLYDSLDQTVTTPTLPGTYSLKVSVEEGSEFLAANDLTSETWSFTISLGKNEITKKPAVPSLTYNGESQALIIPGTASHGTLEYRLNGGTWSTDVPTATEAGTYTVSYRVIGNEYYENLSEETIIVKIRTYEEDFEDYKASMVPVLYSFGKDIHNFRQNATDLLNQIAYDPSLSLEDNRNNVDDFMKAAEAYYADLESQLCPICHEYHESFFSQLLCYILVPLNIIKIVFKAILSFI